MANSTQKHPPRVEGVFVFLQFALLRNRLYRVPGLDSGPLNHIAHRRRPIHVRCSDRPLATPTAALAGALPPATGAPMNLPLIHVDNAPRNRDIGLWTRLANTAQPHAVPVAANPAPPLFLRLVPELRNAAHNDGVHA